MSSLDHLLQKLRKPEGRRPTESVARFVVTKLSWRGNYKRLLCITPSAVVTQYTDSLAVTNSWAYAGDHDLAGVEVGGEHAEGGVFTLHFRRDKKGLKSKDAKFACKDRAALLCALCFNISIATARGLSGLGTTVLGAPDSFSGHKLKKGKWVPANLRVTAFALERLDPGSGTVRWRLEFRHMASPAVRLLSAADAAGGAPAPAGQAAFAVFGKTGRSPRVYCCRDRDGFLRRLQEAALKKMGLTLAVDTNAQMSGQQLLSMVGNAERERAAGQSEAPLGEWEVTRVCDVDTLSASDLAASKMDGGGGVKGVVQRRLVLTQSGLLERRLSTYEVAEWRQLAAVAAVVRYAEDPQWLAVEWADGAPASVYLTPAREALLAALLDAAQASAGRPIPVLSQPTGPGDVIVAHRFQAVAAPLAEPDPELERMALGHLTAAAKDFMASGSAAVSLSALAHAGLAGGSWGGVALSPEASSVGAAPSSGPSEAGSDDQDGSEAVGSPVAGGRGGFMRRAFSRQQQTPGGGASGSAGSLTGSLSAGAGSSSAESAACLFQQRVREFNACVPLAGVSPGAKVEDPVIAALLAHLPRQQHTSAADKVLGQEEGRVAAAALQALQRLASSLAAAATIVGPAGGAGRIFAGLQSGNDHVAFESGRLLTRLFAPAAARAGMGPWHVSRNGLGGDADPMSLNTPDETAAARSAKSVCFISDTRCAALPGVLRGVGGHSQSALVAMAATEALAAAVCEPGSRTTDPHTLSLLLQETASLGHPLFMLFNHPAPRVAEAAALLMRSIAEGGAAAAEPMRVAALSEGAILHHLINAVGPQSPRAKLSQELVAVWADEYSPALALLRRIFPPGLMRYLSARPRPAAAPAPAAGLSDTRRALPATASQEQPTGPAAGAAQLGQQQGPAASDPLHLRPAAAAAAQPAADPLQAPAQQPAPAHASAGAPQAQQQGAVLPGAGSEREPNQRPPSPLAQRLLSHTSEKEQLTLRLNWEAFWGAVGKDHCHAGLIWNERTRAELREALQAEEGMLRMGRLRANNEGSGAPPPCWNHVDFRVVYPSLAKHLCIGGVYVRLLLDGSDPGALQKLAAPKEFFTSCYHHFLCLGDPALFPPAGSTGPGATGAGALPSLAVAESSDPAADRELCVRALAATYTAHAGAVGPFEGVAPALRLLDATPSAPLRQYLLKLIEALVEVTAGPSGAAAGPAGDGGAAAARKANATAIVETGGVELLVDLITTAHEASERPVAAPQSNLIAAGSFAEERKEWYCYPEAEGRQWGAGSDLEAGRQGPLSKDEVRQMAARGALTAATPVWAAGMPQPLPLGAVRELRWWVARGRGPLTPFQVAGTALRVLLALVRLHPATDEERGAPLLPLPLAHRQMAAPRCLPHIAQAVLTNEPSLVAGACELLAEVLAHNAEALAGLYRTGIFFFLLAYCGSNLGEAARLLKIAHLHQHFRGVREAASGEALAQRSILGGLLPESLLYQLESYGPKAFAAALVGDSDTPELIWTHRMRGQRLVPQMLQHLGDFPRRLAQHAHTVYEYTPCPPVGYPEIEGEIWCHRYYLRHLADEDRFAGWPIVDHVPFLQALLDEWRAELARKPLSMSEGEACKVLGLEPRPDGGPLSEDELKAAYRRLARLYHPDKNPAGRDKFVAVHKAYERLQAGAAGGQGPQPWRVLLILKAQCILFRRYPAVLQPFKYAGYPLLLQAITLAAAAEAESQPHFLSEEVAPRLQAAVQLCWLTCACSALNGEELTRSGGVGLLGELLLRCVAVIPRDVAPHQPAAVIATHSLRALAVMAAFESARAELAKRPQLVADVVWCCGLERAAAAVDAALLAVVQMCQSQALQTLLLRNGMLGWVVPLLLAFDTTHADAAGGEQSTPVPAAGEAAGGGGDEAKPADGLGRGLPPALDIGQGGRSVPDFLGLGVERANMQAARNLHAMLAVRALAALAGYPGTRPATPANPEAQEALRALLTEALAPRLAAADPRPLLRDLNSTVQTPQAIWNNKMREELLELMEAQRREGQGLAQAAAAAAAGAAPAAAGAAAGFAYSALKGELVVAGVFVRVFNEQPTFPVSDPTALCKGLVTFLHQAQRAQQQGGGAADAVEQRRQQQHMLQALLALRHVLEAAPRLLGLLSTRPALEPLLDCVAPACTLGHLGSLWPATAAAQQGQQAQHDVEAAELALGVLLRLTAHAGCVEAMAQERCVMQAYWLAHRPPSSALLLLALRLLHTLADTPAAAWSAAAHAGTLYLLSLLLPATLVSDETERSVQDAGRVAAAALLGRLLAQPLHGPRVGLVLGKFLPPGLLALIQDDSGEAVVAALGQTAETPERLWNRSMYQAAAEEVAHQAAAARAAQAAGRLEWALPEGFQLRQEGGGAGAGELFLGGVYVRLFLKNPQYPLRNPKAFLEALLERHLAILQAATPAAAAALGSPLRPARSSAAGAPGSPTHPAAQQGASAGAAAGVAAGGVQPDADLAVLLSAAAVAVLQHNPPLAEHAVALGYVDKLMKLLAARLPPLPPGGLLPEAATEPAAPADDFTGSVLRLLHQLSSSLPAAEALARCAPPAVPTLSATLLCGTAAAVLGLETLKRALTPVNRSRDLLVGACLSAGLPQALLQRLDWRSKGQHEGEEDRDEAVQRVLLVDLLNLLATDGAYGERARALLDQSEVWRAYRDQRHDLFLPAGGAPSAGVVGLLRGPEMARFALPPALSPASPTAPGSSADQEAPFAVPAPIVPPALQPVVAAATPIVPPAPQPVAATTAPAPIVPPAPQPAAAAPATLQPPPPQQQQADMSATAHQQVPSAQANGPAATTPSGSAPGASPAAPVAAPEPAPPLPPAPSPAPPPAVEPEAVQPAAPPAAVAPAVPPALVAATAQPAVPPAAAPAVRQQAAPVVPAAPAAEPAGLGLLGWASSPAPAQPPAAAGATSAAVPRPTPAPVPATAPKPPQVQAPSRPATDPLAAAAAAPAAAALAAPAASTAAPQPTPASAPSPQQQAQRAGTAVRLPPASSRSPSQPAAPAATADPLLGASAGRPSAPSSPSPIKSVGGPKSPGGPEDLPRSSTQSFRPPL